MSEMINNREYRQKILKELITELHNGKSVEEIKPRFEKLIEGISVNEISEMEQALIMEGMPVQEIQRLCDVHASLFKGSIEDIHKPQAAQEQHGHPVHIFKLENREIEKLINNKLKKDLESFKRSDDNEAVEQLLEDFNLFLEVNRHYSRKENLVFPYMEKYGITAPPKVMWGVDDEIRAAIKETRRLLQDYNGKKDLVIEKAEEAMNKAIEMVFKEENILFPMIIETLTEDEWKKIAEDSAEIGFSFITPKTEWKPERKNLEKGPVMKVEELKESTIPFDAGYLTHEEINAMMNTLPLDITFVDKDGAVKYFTQGKERIFARPKSILGRLVSNCHPPASVHVVEKIVEELKSGKKEHEDFWIRMGDKYVYIRYYAVRNAEGDFLGIMEVTQDIAPIQKLSGEKRLVSE